MPSMTFPMASLMLGIGLIAAPAAAQEKKPKQEGIRFTAEEAKFLGLMADDAKLIEVMKMGLKVVDAVDTAWPTSAEALTEYLMKMTIEVAFNAPKVEDGIKSLETIKCKAIAGDVQLFLEGKHPKVKGSPSKENKKYFQAMVECFEKKK